MAKRTESRWITRLVIHCFLTLLTKNTQNSINLIKIKQENIMSDKSEVLEQRRQDRKEGTRGGMTPRLSNEEVLAEFKKFNASHSSVVLGTVNSDGDADTTYAPCLQKDGLYYVYISELAVHTKNLFNHMNASLLYIEPEDKAKNLFKRRRTTIRVEASTVERGSDKFIGIMDDYLENFGGIMKNLRDSLDFHLFELSPKKATYVRGFGQAYNIVGAKLDEVKHMGDRGHGQSKMSGHGHGHGSKS